jgi:hypothetical protein
MKLITPRHGFGKLQAGSSKGRRGRIITRTFREIAEQILNDPDVVQALKRRVLLELAGRQSRPVPALAVLGAATQGQMAKTGSDRGAVTFAVQIVAGRGVVERVEGPGDRPLLDAKAEVLPETNATEPEKEKT